jgi:hypothetical protein
MFTTTPVYYILHEKRHYNTYFYWAIAKWKLYHATGRVEALARDPTA